jgi:hypothetical protein
VGSQKNRFSRYVLSTFVVVLLQSPTEGDSMANVSSIVRQLKKERDRVAKQLSGLDAALRAFANVYGGRQPKKRWKMSAKSRAKIAAAQRRRWRKVRAKRK